MNLFCPLKSAKGISLKPVISNKLSNLKRCMTSMKGTHHVHGTYLAWQTDYRNGQSFFKNKLLNKPFPKPGPKNVRTFRLKVSPWDPKHKVDGVAKDNLMIYANNHSLYVFSSYFMTSVMAFVCTVSVLVKLYEYGSRLPTEIFDSESEVPQTVLLAFAGIVLVMMIKILCSRTLIRIYYSKPMDSYIGVSMNWRLKRQLFYFQKQDVKVKPADGNILGEMYGNVIILGKHYTLQEKDFKNAYYYSMLMGYSH